MSRAVLTTVVCLNERDKENLELRRPIQLCKQKFDERCTGSDQSFRRQVAEIFIGQTGR